MTWIYNIKWKVQLIKQPSLLEVADIQISITLMRHLHRHLPHFIGKVQYSGGALALNLGKLSNIETRVSFNLHHCQWHVIQVETVETIKTGFL